MKTRQHKAQIGKNNGVRFGTRRRLLNSLVVLLCAAGPAYALPTSPQVINGTAGIVINGNAMTVTNSPNAIINWGSFSIASGETTRFVQQSAASAVLNRVTGGDPSAIYGSLLSNGKVFLINQNGILFGPGAVVNVNGLVASTLNITNEDFLAGKMKFTAGAVAGTVENQGTITTPSGGQVYLIAPDVQNSGVITAPNGDILLAAGREILLVDSATPEIAVVVSAPEHQAINLGTLTADAGRIGLYGGIVRQKGIVSANSAVRDASGRIFLKATKEVTAEAGSITSANGPQGGSVTLQASEGTTLVSGTVEAKGSEGTGGTVQVLGKYAGLFDSAIVDASGSTGGGTVLLGGDYQGKNAAVQNALATYLGKDAVIKADATDNGNGGKVIVWSDNATRAYGSVFARGGANGGDGGFVETSGHWLDVNGVRVATLAPNGAKGTWLLDPSDITITSSGVGALSGGIFDPAGATGTISWSTIEGGLASGNVTVQTSGGTGGNGDITADDGYTFANAGAGVLTLHADRDIVLNRTSLDLTGNPMGFTLLAGRNVSINNRVSLAAINVTATSGNVVVSSAGGLSNSSTISLTATAGAISYSNAATALSAPTITLNAATGIYGTTSTDPFRINYLGAAAILSAHNTGVGAIRIQDSSYGGLQVVSAVQDAAGQLISISTSGGMTPTLSINGSVAAAGGLVKLSGETIDINAGGNIIGDEVNLEATGSGGINLSGGSLGGVGTRRIELVSDKITGGGTAISTSTASVQNEVQLTPYTANTLIGVGAGSGALLISQTLLNSITTPTLVIGKESGSGTAAGDISVMTINWNNGQRLALLSGGEVTGGGITATKLGVIAGGKVDLSSNSVGSVAIRSDGGGVIFGNNTGFSVVSETGGIMNPTTISGVTSNGAPISLTAASGDIWIASPVDAGAGAVDVSATSGGIYTSSGGSVNIIGGSFSSYAGTNIGGPTYSLMTKTPLWSTLHAGGSLYLDNIGAVSTGSSLVDVGSVAKLTAHSPLTIGTGGVQAGSDITLEASPMGGLDDLTINGPVTSSSGNIYLRAGNQIFENALITALNGSVTRTPFLNGMLVPPNLQPQTPSAPLYSDDEVPAGLVLVSLEEQKDSEEDKDKKYGTSQEDRTRSGDTQNAKPKKNYCN